MLSRELTEKIGLIGSGDVAIYDLEIKPTTYDFAVFAVIAKTLGAKEVRFVYNGVIQTTKYPEDYAWRRWANICIPICRLVGLKYSLGPKVEGFTHWYHYGSANAVYKELGRIEGIKLPETIEKGRGNYVTVTLRDSIRNKYRDTDLKVWGPFVEFLRKRHKVEILGDCEFAPISIEYRMSIYSGAQMNFAVSNGPNALCHFSEAPYITTNMLPDGPGDVRQRMINYLAHGGFPEGSQLHFRSKNQRFIWEPDSLKTLKGAYEWWRDENSQIR